MKSIYDYQPLWGSWYIDKLVGSGGFGKVYRANKKLFDENYYSAIKHFVIPNEEMLKSTTSILGISDKKQLKEYYDVVIKDLITEINILSKLKGHSNIISFEDYLVEEREDLGWDIFIRMEYATPLNEYLLSNKVTETLLISLAIDICKGLSFCHKNGIIHRDIKVENIFYSEIKRFKIGDFGISKLDMNTLSAKTRTGTPFYMAPEVLSGNSYNNSVDIYSLGIVLYKLANKGAMPFINTNGKPNILHIEESEKKRLSGDKFPKLTNVSLKFSNIISKACEYSTQDRYQSVDEMIADLAKLNCIDSEDALDLCLSQHIENSNIEKTNCIKENSTQSVVTQNLISDKTKDTIPFDKNSSTEKENIDNIKSDETIGVISKKTLPPNQSSKIAFNKKIVLPIFAILLLTSVFSITFAFGIIKFPRKSIIITPKNTSSSIIGLQTNAINSTNLQVNMTNTNSSSNVTPTNTSQISNTSSATISTSVLSNSSNAINSEIVITSKGSNPEIYSDSNGWKGTNRFFAMDINGDGKTDLLSRNSSGRFVISFAYNEKLLYQSQFTNDLTDSALWSESNRIFIMDINGDNKDDLLLRRKNGDMIIHKSDGTKFAPYSSFTTSFSDDKSWLDINRFFVMDVNGDNKDDLVVRYPSGILGVLISNGTTLNTSEIQFQTEFSDSSGWTQENRFFIMDINGDRKKDLVVRYGNGNICEYLSDGSKFSKKSETASEFSDAAQWKGSNNFFAMDINGDGKDELVARYQSGIFNILRSNGSSISTQSSIYSDSSNWNQGNRFCVMDINGDGKDDIVTRFPDGKLGYMKSTGSSFVDVNTNLFN